jgi:hypothetical protein
MSEPTPSPAGASADQDNVVVRMFEWWNRAYRDGCFTPSGFRRFFTEQAPFVVDGGVRGVGPDEISGHFERVLAATETVELVLPVEATLAAADLAFVRYRATAKVGGRDQAEECMAMARLRDNRITSFEVISRSI